MEEINVLVKVTCCKECPSFEESYGDASAHGYCKDTPTMMTLLNPKVIDKYCPWRKMLWNTKRT